MVDNETANKRWSNAMMMGATQAPSVEFVTGSGLDLTDADGKHYLDFISGIAVNALGHAHPAIIDAVTKQVSTLGHVSNLYASEPPIQLAERLLSLFPPEVDGRVFFANSGAEANEAAFKIARKTGRPNIVAMNNSFHGRTMGSLAMTGQPKKQEPFAPLPGPVTFVEYGDIEALRGAVDENTAAVIMEPLQGEGGVIVPPAGYLAEARAITRESGALLIFDEVQTGIGRTGKWFAHQHDGVQPDVMSLAKGLGGGLPIGASIAFGPARELLVGGDHASTFGGNPIACAAALAVLDTIELQGLLQNVTDRGNQLRSALRALGFEVRGKGLLNGLLVEDAPAFESAALDAGYLVNAVQPGVVRIAPPLIVTAGQIDQFLSDVPKILAAL